VSVCGCIRLGRTSPHNSHLLFFNSLCNGRMGFFRSLLAFLRRGAFRFVVFDFSLSRVGTVQWHMLLLCFIMCSSCGAVPSPSSFILVILLSLPLCRQFLRFSLAARIYSFFSGQGSLHSHLSFFKLKFVYVAPTFTDKNAAASPADGQTSRGFLRRAAFISSLI
jgi:hypothetical protein